MAGKRYAKYADDLPLDYRSRLPGLRSNDPGDDIFPGCEITQEQMEFGAAMERERRRLGRFLDFTDVLRVARELGYARVPITDRLIKPDSIHGGLRLRGGLNRQGLDSQEQ